MWAVDRDRMPMWVVYNNPSDYPGQTIARLWYALPEPGPTNTTFVASHHMIQAAMRSHGYVQFQRSPTDDPCIVEVWI